MHADHSNWVRTAKTVDTYFMLFARAMFVVSAVWTHHQEAPDVRITPLRWEDEP